MLIMLVFSAMMQQRSSYQPKTALIRETIALNQETFLITNALFAFYEDIVTAYSSQLLCRSKNVFRWAPEIGEKTLYFHLSPQPLLLRGRRTAHAPFGVGTVHTAPYS